MSCREQNINTHSIAQMHRHTCLHTRACEQVNNLLNLRDVTYVLYAICFIREYSLINTRDKYEHWK